MSINCPPLSATGDFVWRCGGVLWWDYRNVCVCGCAGVERVIVLPSPPPPFVSHNTHPHPHTNYTYIHTYIYIYILKKKTHTYMNRQTCLLVREGGPDVVVLGHHRLVRPQDDLGAVLVHLWYFIYWGSVRG
jgi:hypothetical protein